jgi:preprotein translocase subunit Sec61beta
MFWECFNGNQPYSVVVLCVIFVIYVTIIHALLIQPFELFSL